MLPTGQCYQWDQRRLLRDKVNKIFCSQKENVTDRTMLLTGQCYRRDNVIDGTKAEHCGGSDLDIL